MVGVDDWWLGVECEGRRLDIKIDVYTRSELEQTLRKRCMSTGNRSWTSSLLVKYVQEEVHTIGQMKKLLDFRIRIFSRQYQLVREIGSQICCKTGEE